MQDRSDDSVGEKMNADGNAVAKANDQTILCHVGRETDAHYGAVNTPVYHASTILFPTLAAHDAKQDARVRYGRRGTPTQFSLEDAVSALEGAAGTVLTPSGAMAISTALLAFARAGAHYLIPDNVYGPCRHCCTEILKPLGVDVTYYDPAIGAGIADLMTPATRLIWMEAPGSQTFEMCDIGAIARVARERDVITVIDNTWAAGFYLKPLALGIDISLQAGTKYLSGHSDVMMGTLACASNIFPRIKDFAQRLGVCVGPDDAYLVNRGMRTLAVRMRQHNESAFQIALWLQSRPEVLKVLHPALPDDPGHFIWKEYFTGASGLFGFILKPVERSCLAKMLDDMKYFGMGASWGGYESLLIPTNPAPLRTATAWRPEGQSMRIHVGLEDPADLIADLEAGFERLAAAERKLANSMRRAL